MSTYSLNDFTESLERVHLPFPPAECLRAWGESANGPGCEWSGGFLLRLQDRSFAYVSGWCDYTGWGCQDGAHATFGKTLAEVDLEHEDHSRPESESSWDDLPADLNRWIKAGMPEQWDSDTWEDIGTKGKAHG